MLALHREGKGDAQISLGVARGGLEERGGAGLVRRDDGLVTDVVREDVVVLSKCVDGRNVRVQEVGRPGGRETIDGERAREGEVDAIHS